MVKCKHAVYATNLSARKAAKDKGVDPRRKVHRCPECGKWRVMP